MGMLVSAEISAMLYLAIWTYRNGVLPVITPSSIPAQPCQVSITIDVQKLEFYQVIVQLAKFLLVWNQKHSEVSGWFGFSSGANQLTSAVSSYQ